MILASKIDHQRLTEIIPSLTFDKKNKDEYVHKNYRIDAHLLGENSQKGWYIYIK